MAEQEFSDINEIKSKLRLSADTGQIWLDEQRMILVHAQALGSLRRELIETLGSERARGLLTRMGYSSGTRDAQFARKLFPEVSDDDLLMVGPRLHNLEGIVNVSRVKLDMDIARGLYYGEFIWEDSFECEVHRQSFGLSHDPACWMQIGYAAGYTTELMRKFILYREVSCTAVGDPYCRIIGKPKEEWDDAEEDMKYFQPESVADHLLELQVQVEKLRYSIGEHLEPKDMVGSSSAFNAACDMLRKAADSQVTVLLLGETGVGKELFARTLHKIGPRSNAPFVAVNCAAIPEALIESELFGVEKGAFTGATKSRPGRFERAHGGTLFLDEVADLSAAAQAKLLRVLQDNEIERVGDTRTRKVNVRLVAATNKELQIAIEKEQFRADLYYRLNVYPVMIPPLRERKDDIPQLVQRFLDKYTARHGKKVVGITGRAMTALMEYDWPGNIRELENVIERGVILVAAGETIGDSHLFPSMNVPRTREINPDVNIPAAEHVEGIVDALLTGQVELDAFEQKILSAAVKKTKGNLSSAARMLGLTRPQLAYRLNKYKNASG